MTGPDEPAHALPHEDDEVPLVLRAQWDQAEARLYPAVTTRPDLYQRVVVVVARTAERLRALGPSTGALLAAHERGADLVAEVMDELGLSAAELDLTLLAQAALALRHREVAAAQASRRRLRLIAEGQRTGATWVVLEERGHLEGDPFMPYTRLEVEVASGRALLVAANGDEDFRRVLHSVQDLRVDLATGILYEPDGGDVAATSHPDFTAREEQVTIRKAMPRDP